VDHLADEIRRGNEHDGGQRRGLVENEEREMAPGDIPDEVITKDGIGERSSKYYGEPLRGRRLP